LLIAFSLCLLSSGCQLAPPPEDSAQYSATLNHYYEGRPLCLWADTVKFPAEDISPSEIEERGFNALVDADLLVRRPARKGAPEGSFTYDLSAEGRAAISPDIFNQGAGNFCYGRRKVVSVDAAREKTTTTELVEFRYGLPAPAPWAMEYSLQSAFPQIASELAGSHRAQALLLDTTEGWEVTGEPAVIAPVATGAHASAVAKAWGLLHPRKKQSA
jgi:hypothetical protein